MSTKTKAYSWVPTTYLAEALPNQLVTMISMFLLLDMGVTNYEWGMRIEEWSAKLTLNIEL